MQPNKVLEENATYHKRKKSAHAKPKQARHTPIMIELKSFHIGEGFRDSRLC